MSIIEKAAQKIAKAAIKADVSAVQKNQARMRRYKEDDFLEGYETLKKTAYANKLEELGILGTDLQLRRTADEYRRIKRPLLANAFGLGSQNIKNGSLVAVASALQGEGKTFTSINLALSIARERNHTVLLVDTDSAKAGLSSIFGLENNKGLMDVLADDALGIEDVIIRIDELNVSIVPAGARHDDSAELLASEKMRQVTNEMVSRYPDRLVIFDSPPLLLTSDSQIIAELVGQIVMVIAAVETPKNVVMDALNLLDTDKPVNLILNKTNRSLGIDYYGGYYGYR